MYNLLILQCDQEQRLKKIAERMSNMRLLVELPDTDADFVRTKNRWREEIRTIEKQRI